MLPYITANALQRVVRIQVVRKDKNAVTGTAFFIDVHGREYLVTAKHVLAERDPAAPICINHHGKWVAVQHRLVGDAPDGIDISVLALPARLVDPDLSLPPTGGGLVISQEVYFLGFPFGMSSDIGDLNNNYPLPFVKRATLSSFEHRNDLLHKLYLDGINNPGFSGGPVVFFHEGAFKVCGVIHGFEARPSPLFMGGNRVEAYVSENTGIIHAFGIGYAVRIANADIEA